MESRPKDEPVKLPDDPEAILRAMLKVDPDAEPEQSDDDESERRPDR